MARGRKPQPTAMKELAGNPGKRPLNADEPQFAVKVPTVPEHLDDVARAEWERLVGELEPVGLVAEVYRGLLAGWCVCYSRWVYAEQQIVVSGGPVLTSENGGTYQNPWLSVANRALAQMQSIGAEFGMSPSSKTRVRAAKGAAPQSALKVFANKRGA